MIAPSSVYIFFPSNVTQYRLIYSDHDGVEIPELTYVLTKGKDKGLKTIGFCPMSSRKGAKSERTAYGLKNPRLCNLHPELIEKDPISEKVIHKPVTVSNIYEPYLEHPGEGYGDIRGTEHAFISVRNPEGSGKLFLYIYEGLKKQKEILFRAWIENRVSFVPLNNKMYLGLDIDGKDIIRKVK